MRQAHRGQAHRRHADLGGGRVRQRQDKQGGEYAHGRHLSATWPAGKEMEENGRHVRSDCLAMAPLAELHAQLVALLPRLRRYARTLARNVHDADDLVQLALERALTRAEQLQADAPLAGWIYGIVRNAWIDEVR